MIDYRETLTDVFLNITFPADVNRNELVTETIDYLNYVTKFADIKLSISENSDWNQDIEPNINVALTFIDEHLAEQANDDTEYAFKIEFSKPTSGNLSFYSYIHFVEALDSDLKLSLKQIDKAISSFQSLYLFTEKKEIQFHQSVKNNYNADNIFHRYNFDIKPKITPEHLFKLGQSLEDINEINVFYKLSTYMSLVIFSNKVKKENDCYSFFFNGLKSIALEIDFNSDTRKIYNETHDLFRWVFEDTGAVAKISIIRNIFTAHDLSNLDKAFSQDTISAIESNHQLYQEDNVKQYFEIKNKIVDFIFGLSNKMSDSYDAYYASNKVNLVALLSYIVTLIVIRGMSKTNFDESINLFCFVSLAFFVVALIYTYLVQSELTKKVQFYEDQKGELHSQYQNVLSNVELTKLFDSPSYKSAKCRSEEAKFHYIVSGILIVFILVDVVILGIRLSMN